MKTWFKAWWFLAVLWMGQAQAELTIEITKGMDNPTPIAIVPFKWDGAPLPEDVSAIVSADLQRSGQFMPLERGRMLSWPHEESQVFYRDWRIIKQDYLVIGRMTQVGGQYQAEYELYDILREQRLLSGRVNGGPDNLRDIAHFISDQVYEKLTGIRGAFSTRISYVSAQRGGAFRLIVADADGARARTILESREPILSPSWSKDGKRLAYVSFETSRPAVYIQDLSTGQRQRLKSFPGLNGAPSWSPDGRKLAMVLSKDGNPEVYTFDMQTLQLERITEHFAIDTEPSWAPDGQHIIFTSDRGGQPQIYKVNIYSRSVQRLTFEGNYNSRGKLSADGRFLVTVHRNQRGGIFHVAVHDLQNGRVYILTDTTLDESPSIAPNGTMVIYATKEGGRGVLGVVSMDGRVKYRLPDAFGDVREPDWSPYLN
ncbi:Tol-Pal system beta propeller repeat protein TolB [Balneatrix alpica]|uniref:Tol-Pal system beta propeller repeat protein TolB n=1 Tax=Balneatrix alpica TaxID=75684 RepID=UPI00273924E0|nr:Tol-Pal system beta propeller repeat protein TolB [Balneatrix alpica]